MLRCHAEQMPRPSDADSALSAVLSERTVLPQVGLITIWYRATAADINRFVLSLKLLEYPHLQLIFVIHEQTNDDIDRLRALVPQAQIILSGDNLGTAAGWNLGVRYLLKAGVKYIGICNVDVKPHPQYLAHLVEILEQDRSIGAAVPLLLYSDEPQKVQAYGASINPRTGLGRHDYDGVTNLSILPTLRDVDYLDGGTMVVRAEVFRQVGEFDEALFMYCEDSDMSLRIQQAGYRTVAVRDSRVWHYHRENRGGIIPPYEVFYITRNQLYFVRKHHGGQMWLWAGCRAMCSLPRRLLFYLRRGQWSQAWAYVCGIWCGMAARFGKRGWVS